MSDDEYDDAADRVKGQVPDELESQTDIRNWIEDNIDWGLDTERSENRLNDEVVPRIASAKETEETVEDTGFLYDPETGDFTEL